MSYEKYAQNSVKTADTFEIDKSYWQSRLEGETVLSTFPYTASSFGQNRSEYQSISKQVEKNIYDRLASISKKSEPGTYMLLLSALTYLLYRYTGNDEILLGMPAFRDAEGITSTNMLFLKTCIDEDISFREFLIGIRNTVMEADEHSGFSYLEALRFLGLKSNDAKLPLVNTIVMMEQIHDDSILRHVNADMIFRFSLEEGLLTISLCYCKNMYDEQTPVQILNQLMNVLTAITENPGTLMSEIGILSKEDKRRLIEEFNDSKAQYPADKTIHGLFEERAAKTPENIALTFENSVMTYGELNERSSKLARTLRNIGVGRDSITAVMAEHSMDMIIAALAVLKAGGAYLPIDPAYPQDRIKYMLQDSGAVILLTQSNIDRGYLSEDKNNMLPILDIDKENSYSDDGSDLENINLPSDLAYVIYTSGTTGRPKGAMIEHRNVVRLLFNDRFQFEFGSEDVWTMFHSFCFDFSVWEMYGALLYGGRLVIVPRHIAQDPGEYLILLKEQHVTVLNQTPTAFYNLIKEEMEAEGKKLSIRYVVFGGEALKPAMLKSWREKYPGTRLINMYGITETTVHVTFKEITEKEIESNISNTDSIQLEYLLPYSGKHSFDFISGCCVFFAGNN
ncbi:MAG TPA: AMP-binding protein [Clostridia bacterium]|nr:AMP-binding protein [Clostridia bacterium]